MQTAANLDELCASVRNASSDLMQTVGNLEDVCNPSVKTNANRMYIYHIYRCIEWYVYLCRQTHIHAHWQLLARLKPILKVCWLAAASQSFAGSVSQSVAGLPHSAASPRCPTPRPHSAASHGCLTPLPHTAATDHRPPASIRTYKVPTGIL